MLFNAFLKNGVVYIPTVVKLTTGAYVDVDPVAVEAVANTAELRRAFGSAVARKNAVVSPPPKGRWPPPVLLKYTGAKSWSAFARGASMWSIEERSGNYQIVGHRDHPDGYWVPDSTQTIDFPPGTPVDAVIDRMIAILREAASGPNAS